MILIQQWSAQVKALAATVRALDPLVTDLGLPSPTAAAWYGALFQKLLPQVEQELFLIAAVTGGTNTGKSVIFNHLAGGVVSRAHPNATQTRQPVCLVPQTFSQRHRLAELFPDFELRPWANENDPLNDGPEQVLFVREDPLGRQPSRLLLLDTPDVDGTLKTNWRRADLVRHAADVLVCILTQQKYNDAAIREFFRAAAAADKTVIVVFNMVHWPRQRELCCGWLKQFSRETGVKPAAVYAVPWDPEGAQRNQLPFYPLSPGGADLRDDLADLQFDTIKIRSLAGSWHRVLDDSDGLPAYLQAIDQRAGEYAGARDLLDKDIRKQPVELPDLPRRLVWDEIWNWLESRRTRFDRLIHGRYRALSEWVTQWWRSDPAETLDEFRRAEFERLQAALAAKLDQLDLLQRGGNAILARELATVLGGLSRSELYAGLKTLHQNTPLVTDGYRKFIHEQLDVFERQNPALVKGITSALVATAVVRPAVSIGLLLLGAHGVELAAGHWAGAWVGDVAVGTATAAAGEAVTVPTGQLALKALLSGLFAQFYMERVNLLTKTLDDRVLGPVVSRLNRLAVASEDPQLRQAEQLIATLRTSLDETTAPAQVE